MNQADFWSSQEKAQATIAEFKLLKVQTEGLADVISGFEDARVGYELAKEAGDRELLVAVRRELLADVAAVEPQHLRSPSSARNA